MNLEQRYNSVLYSKNFHYVEVPGLIEVDPTRIKTVLKLLDVPIVSQFIDNGRSAHGNHVKHWLDKSIVLLPRSKLAILHVRDYAEVSYQCLSTKRWFL